MAKGTGGTIIGGLIVGGIAWYYLSQHPGTFSKISENLGAIAKNTPSGYRIFGNASAPVVQPDTILGNHNWQPPSIDISIPG